MWWVSATCVLGAVVAVQWIWIAGLRGDNRHLRARNQCLWVVAARKVADAKRSDRVG